MKERERERENQQRKERSLKFRATVYLGEKESIVKIWKKKERVKKSKRAGNRKYQERVSARIENWRSLETFRESQMERVNVKKKSKRKREKGKEREEKGR